MDKNTQELIDAGNDILKSVSKAIDTNDYSKLASDITRTVKAVSIDRKTIYSSGMKNTYSARGQGSYNQRRAPRIYPFLQKKISKYNGLAEIILGLSAEVFMLFPILIGSFFTGSLPFIITMVALNILGGLITLKGFKKLKLAKKLYQYGNILKDAEYFAITDLARASLKSDEEVLKDIKALINEGYLPRAKLDASETTCMITDAAYQMYLGAEQDRIAREQKQAQENAVLGRSNVEDTSLPANVRQLINDGNEYISFVRGINDIIPDTEEMSDKLYKLESIMNRIFDQVKKDPSSADELHKLMNYYLPTTKKLLTAYVELDKQPDAGENVIQTKKEIDLAMDTINMAFEKLLDSLFQEMAWDISSDISVMKTMMAQDGLTDDGGIATATASQTATASASAVMQEKK